MHPDPLRNGESRGHQHRRPDDGVKPGDVLSDQVQIRRPQPLEIGIRKSSRGEIVGQRIEPHISRLLLAARSRAREGDAPRKPAPAGRDIVETRFQEREDLVAPGFWLEKFFAGDQLLQPIRVGAQPEKPVLLLDPLERARRVHDAFSIDDLVVLLERLTPDAVPPRVGFLVEVVGRVLEDQLDEALYSRLVRRIRCPDELIEGDSEQSPDLLRAFGDRVHQLLWRYTPLRRGLRDFLAVLVHSDEKVDVVAAKAVITRDYNGADFLERVTLVG